MRQLSYNCSVVHFHSSYRPSTRNKYMCPLGLYLSVEDNVLCTSMMLRNRREVNDEKHKKHTNWLSSSSRMTMSGGSTTPGDSLEIIVVAANKNDYKRVYIVNRKKIES